MINGANLNPEENLVRSIAYENGEALSFVTDQALIDWESYYVRQYRMTDEDVPGISQVIGPAARKVKWIVQWEKTADKQNDCKNKIIPRHMERLMDVPGSQRRSRQCINWMIPHLMKVISTQASILRWNGNGWSAGSSPVQYAPF